MIDIYKLALYYFFQKSQEDIHNLAQIMQIKGVQSKIYHNQIQFGYLSIMSSMIYNKIIKMIKPSVLKGLFRLTHRQKALVMDGPPEDNLPFDLPKDYLDQDVSYYLKIPYLSRCNKSQEQVSKTRVYNGVILTAYNRLFLSIPTYQSQTKRLTNAHYLLDTNASQSTLTQKAKCALHQREYSQESKFDTYKYWIGGKWINIWSMERHHKGYMPRFGNANLLGADFLKSFKKATIEIHSKQKKFNLQLFE